MAGRALHLAKHPRRVQETTDLRRPHGGSLQRTGLIIWPVMAAERFVDLGGIIKSSLAAGWVPGVRDVLGPAALVVVSGFHVGALVLAGRAPGVAAAGGAGMRPERETTARSD
jgi:hypothetical protein